MPIYVNSVGATASEPQNFCMPLFGDFFKGLREEKKWTQDELAYAAKVSRSLVQQAEASEVPAPPSAKKYRQLAEALAGDFSTFQAKWEKHRGAPQTPLPAESPASAAAESPKAVAARTIDLIKRGMMSGADLEKLDKAIASANQRARAAMDRKGKS